jgi:hypothetical protein
MLTNKQLINKLEQFLEKQFDGSKNEFYLSEKENSQFVINDLLEFLNIKERFELCESDKPLPPKRKISFNEDVYNLSNKW